MAESTVVRHQVRRRDIMMGVFYGMSLFVIFWTVMAIILLLAVPMIGGGLVDHFDSQKQQQRR